MDHPLRFSRLGYCRLRCPDLTTSTTFYRDLVGLTLSRSTADAVWLRCSDKPYDLVLEAGDSPGISGIGFELEDDRQIDLAFAIVSGLGLSPQWRDGTSCSALRVERSLLFSCPVTGIEIDFYCGQDVETAPLAGPITKIARLGHIVLNVTDLAAAHDFWVGQLGFAVSDRVEGVAEWLRCWPNPLHHSLALLQSDANTFHHVNFMVTDVDDIGTAMNRMK